MRWAEFAERCSELAELGERRLRGRELCLVGTLRKNGYPRISPCGVDVVEGELLLGMMWRSPKAVDLLRDSRCVVHSVVTDKAGTEGDFKLYGRAVAEEDHPLDGVFRRAIKARTGWDPPERHHLFTIDVEAAGFVVFGDGAYGMAWEPASGLRRWKQRLG